MAVPKNKEELVQAIEDSYAKLKKELNSIPIEMTGKKELEGHAKGTQMSLNDLVSYLVGWSELVLGWCEKKEKDWSGLRQRVFIRQSNFLGTLTHPSGRGNTTMIIHNRSIRSNPDVIVHRI